MQHSHLGMISHISIGTNHFEQAVDFYDAVLGLLDCRRLIEHEGAVGYGKAFPEFWVQTPIDGQPASCGNGFHIGFIVESKSMVDDFYQIALAAGGTCDGQPGPREEYGKPYYGCFVRDLDGHKIEATYWDEALAEEVYGK